MGVTGVTRVLEKWVLLDRVVERTWRRMMAWSNRIGLSLLTAIATSTSVPVIAQNTVTETTAEIEAQAKLIQAKLELNTARVENLEMIFKNLPEFKDKTTTGTDTGKLEATILAAAGLDHVAQQIASKIAQSGESEVLILAGDEKFRLGVPLSYSVEMQKLHTDIRQTCSDCMPTDSRGEAIASVITGISAVAGLLRSEMSLTSLNLVAVDSRMLANAVASYVNRSHVLDGSPGFVPDAANLHLLNESTDWGKIGMVGRKYLWLLSTRQESEVVVDDLNHNKPAGYKDRVKKIKAWMAAFDAFNSRVTKKDDDGTTPLGRAIQASDVEQNLTKIVRVYIQMAGGSLKNSTNIGTFFGGDPLRVTGGIIATYQIFDKTKQFRNPAWGMWYCNSGEYRLKKVVGTNKFTEQQCKRLSE